jgi:hypothetical protein
MKLFSGPVFLVFWACPPVSFSFNLPSQPLNLRTRRSSDLFADTSIDDRGVIDEEEGGGEGISQPIIKSQYCVTGISPSKEMSLNEAVSRITGNSLEEANELIKLGAVWARMDTLTEEELLAQYDNSDSAELWADLPKGWSNPTYEEKEDTDLDEYIEKMESQRFRRILSPTLVQPGTDLRIYPRPRRFPACYSIDESNLLYQDT